MEPLLVKGLLRRIPVVTPRRAKGTIGVLAECYGIWERRSPLTPKHVAGLVQGGHRVLVQPSPRRVFRDAEFAAAGAEVTADLSDCDAVLGVKQPAVSSVLPKTTYAFFSHTIKAQAENMPLLDALAAQECTLVDYECIVKPSGERLVAFGSLRRARRRRAPRGRRGRAGGAVRARVRGRRAVVFGVVAAAGDRVAPRDGSRFDAADYLARPERYAVSYADDWHAKTSLLVNCAYWDERYPRALPHDRLPEFARLRGVADLGCDVGGSVECLERTTTPDLPCYSYDAAKRAVASPDTASGGDFFVLGVDILPAELPREASQHFGDALIGLVPALAAEPPSIRAWPAPLAAATIFEKGALTPYAYVDELRGARGRASEAPAGALTAAGSTVVRLDGHLFDSGLINACLDVVERRLGTFALLGCELEVEPERGNMPKTPRRGAPDADADLTLPAYCRGHYAKTIAHQ
ncbi:saccharopine dehydrogenase [Aureococcus anophagefferens]|nr:saccharopine dehydrogenase [Aureococcus anophagefferens]